MPRIAAEYPETLKPFIFHGLHFDQPDSRGECVGECPACGSGKFAVHADTGMCSCYSAGCPFFVEGGAAAGGSTKFVRWLWEESDKRTKDYDAFAAERGLLYPETLSWWGVCQSLICGAWLFPAYNPEGALVQLYKRVWVKADDRWELRPTPFARDDPHHGHAMHGLPLLDPAADTVYLAEGPGDAMILWESLRISRDGGGRLEFTGNPDGSLLAHASVLAVPNCGSVGEPLRRYLELFRGKRVVLCFDNDHAKNGCDGAGWAATKRAAGMLAGVAREVCRVNWGGSDGHNQELKDGWDVKDALRV